MKILTKPETNSFLGEIEYQYIETGYEEKDYAEIYDFEKRRIPISINLPDKNGLNTLKFNFKTPDDACLENVVLNLDDLLNFKGDQLVFKAVLNDINTFNNSIEFNGNFIFEFNSEDGFHVFNMRLIFEGKELLNNLIKTSFFINMTS